MTLALAVLGFVGAIVAGMLGVGGAIVMIPLLLYVPPRSEEHTSELQSHA